MQRAGLGISNLIRDPAEAARQAVGAALEPLAGEPPDLAWLLVTAAWGGNGAEAVVREAAELLDPDAITGATVDGLAAAGVQTLGNPAVAMLAVSGIRAEPFLLADLAGREDELGERVLSALDRPPGPEDLVLFLLDSVGLAPARALSSLRAAMGRTPLVGIGATAGPMETPRLWHGLEIDSDACAGVVLRGARPPALRVAHGFCEVGPPHRVTRSRGRWIDELDGRPALQVYRAAVPERLRGDPEWAGRFTLLAGLCAGVEPEPPAPWPRAQLLARRLAGIDEQRAAISLPEAIEVGRHVRFLLRDPEAARADLDRQLSDLEGGPGAFGCYLTGQTRGGTLFGESVSETERATGRVPGAALLGVLGAYQLFAPGQAAVPPTLLTHSAVLALLRG